MDRDLSFLIVTPHALRKGLSGVILSRLLSRTGLELAAAKIMAADEAFAKDFADALAPFHSCPCQPEYIRTRFVPVNGRGRAFLALLLKGPSAVEKVAEAAARNSPSATSLSFITIKTLALNIAISCHG